MSFLEAILLGIIQGLTEFLPISSTAHLLIARQLLNHANPRDSFTTVIQLGTLFAVLIYFRKDIFRLVKAVLGDLRVMRLGSTPDSTLAWKIAVGSIPVVACGLAFSAFIKTTLYDPHVIAAAAIVFALLMLEAEHMSLRRRKEGDEGRSDEQITWRDAIWIGCFQALALIPGASRSGVTITAGLFAGLSRSSAARFSFLLSLPSIFGAGVYEFYKDRHELMQDPSQINNLIAGLVAAAIVGYASIAFLLGYLKKHSTYVFIIYRLILGALLFGLLQMNILKG